MVRRAVQAHWIANLIQEAGNKSSLKYLRLDLCKEGHPHPIWTSCPNHTRAIQATALRAKLLTGTYPLQYNLKKTNQHDSDTCRLCGRGCEDMHHFLLACPATDDVREKLLGKITEIFKNLNREVPTSNSLLCRSILNGVPEPVTPRHAPQTKANLVDRRAREQKPLRVQKGGHGYIKCIPCFNSQCKRNCETVCCCFECKRQCERLATAASDLCLRLHLRRSQLLVEIQGAPT